MEERWLLYIDFLGTKNIIETENGLKEFESMVELLSNSNSNFSIRRDGNKSWTPPEFTSFSDHIAISYPLEYELIENSTNPDNSKKIVTMNSIMNLMKIASTIYGLALEAGLLVRGAFVKEN